MTPNERDAEQRKAREEFYKQPFLPNPSVTTEFRVANALEYIAAQLGMINAKLDQLVKATPN